MRVGVGPSLRFLRKQRGLRNLLRLSGASAERLHDALAGHAEIAGFHYFTFNRLLDTWSWATDIDPQGGHRMTPKSLEDLLQTRSPVDLARNSQIGPYVYPKVPAEFTNWREEQVAWRETAALFDQSHHMTDLYISGPDTIRLLSALGVNTSRTSRSGRRSSSSCTSPDGYVIGDAILFYLEDDLVSLVGRPSAHNWVQFHGETGGYDVTFDRDERTAVNPTGKRKLYRFQVQGPNAMQVLEKAVGGAAARHEVLQLGLGRDRRQARPRAASRDVRRPRPGALRALGRRRGCPRGDRRGGCRVRPGAGRLPRVRDEHARVGLDPVPAPGDLHGRRA